MFPPLSCLCGCQALQARRVQCEHQNVDPLVWTSHRVIKWIKDIDLKVGLERQRWQLEDLSYALGLVFLSFI